MTTEPCTCSQPSVCFANFAWTDGAVKTDAGSIPRARTKLTTTDLFGWWQVRWTIGRDHFTVPPDLYAIGNPDKTSNVIVTANYKMSFDHVRRALKSRNTWILVLDTKGINVWCAAGKGTFGTEELVLRIKDTKLEEIVEHKRIIVPQLGASGVCARTVTSQSGFKVTFGPVRASDLPQFIDDGFKATPEMRRVHFTLLDRAILIPVELVLAGKYIIPSILALIAISITISRWLGPQATDIGVRGIVALICAWIAGSILSPLALPVLPGRAFSLKGAIAGIITFCLLCSAIIDKATTLELAAWALMIPAIASFITMNFTGTSTYASPSGVRKEMKYSVPCQIIACIAGLACLTVTYIGLR